MKKIIYYLILTSICLLNTNYIFNMHGEDVCQITAKVSKKNDVDEPIEQKIPKTEEKEECPICQDDLEATETNGPSIALKKCGHKFHSDCVNRWIEQMGDRADCPICRQQILTTNNASASYSGANRFVSVAIARTSIWDDWGMLLEGLIAFGFGLTTRHELLKENISQNARILRFAGLITAFLGTNIFLHKINPQRLKNSSTFKTMLIGMLLGLIIPSSKSKKEAAE